MMELILMTVTTVAILGAVVWYVWGSIGARLGDVAEMEGVGSSGKWDVRIAAVDGRRMVHVVLGGQGDSGEVAIHMFLSATEARRLSQWIRIAATPGRTLADARRKSAPPPSR